MKLDLNGNGALDLASAEPVTLHSRRFQQFGGLWWEVREQSRLVTDGNAKEKLTSSTRRRLGSVFQQ